MQIHELESFIGTTSESTYLAIDDGTETNKIPATDLGITTEMTQAEAETGTETAPRVISPAVLNGYAVSKESATINLDTSATSGDDYNLTQVLTDLGWLNDVIV